MPSRVAVRLLARPMPSSIILPEPILSPIVTGPRCRTPRTFSMFPARPTVCFHCVLQPGRRTYSTNPPPNKPTDDARPEQTKADRPEPQSSPDTTPSSPPHPDPSLPSTSESSRSPLSARFSTFMDNLQSRVLVASQTLNDLTGYSAIDSIKAENAALEHRLAAAQSRLRDARSSYKTLTARRASTQREVTTLLARKDSWAPGDLERFTALYRLDHELEAGVSSAAAELTEAETEEDQLSAQLNAGILRRYHEEQIWSDRIRRQSTWGTWGLMGVNVLLFLGLQFVAEPWRRNRLVKGIAEGERQALVELREEVAAVRAALEEKGEKDGGEVPPPASDAASTPEMAAVAEVEVSPSISTPRLSWRDLLSQPDQWRPALRDLYSERRIDLRMRDATVIAVEGALTGAVVAATVAFALLRRT